MLSKSLRRWLVAAAALGVFVYLGFAVYWSFHRDREGMQVSGPQVSSRLRILTHSERAVREDSSHFGTPIPDEEIDNPLINVDRVAVVNFRNDSDKPLCIYKLGPSLFPGEDIRREFITEIEVRDATGRYLYCGIEPELISMMPPSMPPAEKLQGSKQFTIQPGESIDIPVSILLCNCRELKPGAYTLRAIVSYAEALSGETKRITTEPMTIMVTEDQIKAAEVYWTPKI